MITASAFTSRPLIGLDVDDVLSDTYTLFVELAAEHGIREVVSDRYHPSFWFDATPEQITMLQEVFADRLGDASPVGSGAAVVRELSARFDLVAVTGRSREVNGEATDRFLERWFPGCFRSVHYVDREGTGLSKGEVLRELGAVAMVDDLPEYVHDVVSHGIPVVYFVQGRAWQSPVDHDLVRTVRDWEEIPSALVDLIYPDRRSFGS